MSNLISVNDDMKQTDEMGRVYHRTKIIGGYDAYKDKNGVTKFGTKVFETSNMIVLGGGLFTLEKLFGVTPNLNVSYLEDFLNGFTPPSSYGTALTNAAELSAEIPKVCLFGVGIGGAEDSINSVLDVKYWEREILNMIPLRQTENALVGDDATKYWFKSAVTVGGTDKTRYYLKSFDTTPEIKALWEDSGDPDTDGSEVQSNVYNTPVTTATPIETFVELTLKITKNDIREYFNDTENVGVSRVNTIGLFTGIPVTITDTSVTPNVTFTDYRHVKLFSKLNINNEVMTSGKDLTIIYRIYTS